MLPIARCMLSFLHFHSCYHKNILGKRLMSDEDFEVVLINQCRGTSMPITFSNSKNGPVNIEITVEDDSCLLKKNKNV